MFEAADGPQALGIWEKRVVPIELLITDMVMPNGLTGGQLARELQARDPPLRVVYISGYRTSPQCDLFQPGRAKENSPPIHRWGDSAPINKSRRGRKKTLLRN